MYYTVHYILRNRYDILHCSEENVREIFKYLMKQGAEIVSIRNEYGEKINLTK